jgi:hypothetical protein
MAAVSDSPQSLVDSCTLGTTRIRSNHSHVQFMRSPATSTTRVELGSTHGGIDQVFRAARVNELASGTGGSSRRRQMNEASGRW